jgi:WD40 repeat protein
MELIRGRSLRDYSESNQLNSNQRLAIMVKVCEAVHHAHQRGLIHRDLKPGNILVDETGQPKILDFGVARVTDRDTRATLETDLGQLVGTLAYMSPEQALADPLDIDTRSDVYSLGVILHESLAGRLPYTLGKSLPEAIRVVREKDPERLGSANRAFRGDIETIVARALEKDRTRRYASAAELSADIQRYLNNEPIMARRPSAPYQLRKFARRNRALVGGTAAVFLVLVAGVITTSWLLARTTTALDRARRAEGLAKDNEREATQARVSEREQRNIAEAARIHADGQTAVAQQALSDMQVNLYHSQIQLADREGMASNVQNADRLLDEAPTALRNWEWNYLARRNHMEAAVIGGHQAAILAMALGPDGKQLRTVSSDNTVKVFDLEIRKEISTETLGGSVSDVVLGDSGRSLSSIVASPAGPSSFTMQRQFRNLMTGKVSVPYQPWPVVLSLSPNGRLAAAALDTTPTLLQCWDTETGMDRFAPIEYMGKVRHLVFSLDESMLAVMGNGPVKILNVKTGEELVSFGDPQDSFTAGAFSSDGKTFVAGILNEGVRAWRTLDGRETWAIPGGNLNSIAWSSDSRYIATAGADQTIHLMDSARGREVARLVGHVGAIRALGFTPDGSRLVSVGDDKLVHLWSLREQKSPEILNVGRVEKPMRVSPDGKTLLTATGTSVKSWDTTTARLRFEHVTGSSKWEMGFSRDNAPFVLLNRVTASGDHGLAGRGELVVLDPSTGQEMAVFQRRRKTESEVEPNFGISASGKFDGVLSQVESDFWVSANGKRAAVVSFVHWVAQAAPGYAETHLFEAGSGSINFRIDNPTRIDQVLLPSSRFSPDGKFAGILFRDGPKSELRLEIYDTTTGRRLHRLEAGQPTFHAFSPVGNRLAVVENRRAITFWDAVTGGRLASTREIGKAGTNIVSLAYSPDGTRLASVSSDGAVWLWDTRSGKELILLGASSGPYAVREATVIANTDSLHVLYELPRTERAVSFSRDGGQISLSTVSVTSEGLSIRVEMWDGTPQRG